MQTLSPGDKVALIAPAGQLRSVNRQWLNDARMLLESWQLEVSVWVEDDHHFYLAGDDTRRAKHMIRALTDPDIRAVFCTRGGYGSSRLWPSLDSVSVPTPRLLVGYSDVTSLHLMARARWPAVACVHGVNLATAQVCDHSPTASANRAALHQSLFAPAERKLAVQTICPGRASGALWGGCLSLVTASLGTPYAFAGDGGVLFLEDTGEAPYRLDRALVQLRNAGVFDKVSGVVFGEMPGCTDPYNAFVDIARELLGPFDLPVMIGLTSGHGQRNIPLRLGALATLDTHGAEISVW